MSRGWIVVAALLGVGALHVAAQDARSGADGAGSEAVEVSALRKLLAEMKPLVEAQGRQLESQRLRIERLQSEVEELRQTGMPARPAYSTTTQAHADAAQLEAEVRAMRETTMAKTTVRPVAAVVADEPRPAKSESRNSQLSIRFGNASLTPGGWVDMTAYYRSTDVGSGLGTAFASIPFSNTVPGGLSETRLTAQSSRISLRADESFGAIRVFGYSEADFNGYLPSNAHVSTNSGTFRLRVYFADISRGRWELLAGQNWSLLTPNRAGVSPFLSEIYNTLHLDSNYQVGLTYARQAQLRAVYHFNHGIALGFSAENPEQFSGSAATFPSLFNPAETDLGSSTGAGGGTATPTLHPDLIAKLSADAGWRGREWHFETAGLLSPVAILTPAAVTATTSYKDIREGGGVSASANMEVARNLHLILTGFWSDGGGRYLGGLGPSFVVAQQGATTGPFVAQLVHSGSGIASVEWHANQFSVLSLTYGEAYFGRVFSVDPSTGGLVGYGFAGSANSNNRALNEGTFATQTTLWKQPGYGSVQVITQSSYITRAPWFVAPGAEKSAHVFAGFANLRYVLP